MKNSLLKFPSPLAPPIPLTNLPPVPFEPPGLRTAATEISPKRAAFPSVLIVIKPIVSLAGLSDDTSKPRSPGSVLGEKSMSAPALIDAETCPEPVVFIIRDVSAIEDPVAKLD